ncbi:uncharacterized protein LOC124712168 [Schistocerca piceifrons]|uniref:uncharacterized protein LOC124712168 n=1 Tax=Schistocerca piceifrons TaxID=274613 RepID=UPI001F5E40AA|nr:uncharacterized protein LOC124712168 [Schistocerca piceifrons]
MARIVRGADFFGIRVSACYRWLGAGRQPASQLASQLAAAGDAGRLRGVACGTWARRAAPAGRPGCAICGNDFRRGPTPRGQLPPAASTCCPGTPGPTAGVDGRRRASPSTNDQAAKQEAQAAKQEAQAAKQEAQAAKQEAQAAKQEAQAAKQKILNPARERLFLARRCRDAVRRRGRRWRSKQVPGGGASASACATFRGATFPHNERPTRRRTPNRPPALAAASDTCAVANQTGRRAEERRQLARGRAASGRGLQRRDRRTAAVAVGGGGRRREAGRSAGAEAADACRRVASVSEVTRAAESAPISMCRRLQTA